MRRKKTKPRENPLEKAFVKTCKKMGIQCVKVAFLGTDGAYDRLLGMSGFHCFIEFKRNPNEELTPQQKAVGRWLRKAGLNTMVISDKEEAIMVVAMLVLLDKSINP